MTCPPLSYHPEQLTMGLDAAAEFLGMEARDVLEHIRRHEMTTRVSDGRYLLLTCDVMQIHNELLGTRRRLGTRTMSEA